MESRGFEEMGRGWGWADTAHATELQPGFCSVVRIGRFGPGPVLPNGYLCPDISVETQGRQGALQTGLLPIAAGP